jgi:hypothetical protein
MAKNLLFVVIFFSVNAIAQIKPYNRFPDPFRFTRDEIQPNVSFIGDTLNKCFHCDSKLDSILNLEKDYDFQFRLWKDGFFCTSVFVLTYKNQKWGARYFDKVSSKKEFVSGQKRGMVERKVNPSILKQLWWLMEENEILTLPDQSLIKDRLATYFVDTITYSLSKSTMVMTDGIRYTFELKSPKKKRCYSYSNPESFYKEYKIKELAEVVSTIKIVDKFLELNLED